ncbi:hypothetical protein Tco_0092596 [Tanacetum coccineum]
MDKIFVEPYNKCLEPEAKLVKKKDIIEQDVFVKLLKSYSKLKQHGISLEVAMQLNQEIFQNDKSCENQNAPEFREFFENNELKAHLQTKDTTICNLKKRINSLNEKGNQATVKKDIDEFETINIELKLSVAKLLRENEHLNKEIEHLKKNYKELYDSIKKTRVQTKDHNDSLIVQLNKKFVEDADLKAQIQEKVFATAALKNELRKIKGKYVVDNAAPMPQATIIAPRMFKLDLEPLSPKLLKSRDANINYIKHTQEHADILWEIVKYARALKPLDSNLDSACKYAIRIQEVLANVSATCPSLTKTSEILVVVAPLNKNKKVRFSEPATSSSNTQNQVDSHKTQDSNKLVLPSIGMKSSTSASGSQPSSNTKKIRSH